MILLLFDVLMILLLMIKELFELFGVLFCMIGFFAAFCLMRVEAMVVAREGCVDFFIGVFKGMMLVLEFLILLLELLFMCGGLGVGGLVDARRCVRCFFCVVGCVGAAFFIVVVGVVLLFFIVIVFICVCFLDVFGGGGVVFLFMIGLCLLGLFNCIFTVS